MAKKSTKSSGERKDAAAFISHLRKNKTLRAKLRKGWNEVIQAGKKKGYKFTKQELNAHLKKRYSIKTPHGEDEPDTCLCL